MNTPSSQHHKWSLLAQPRQPEFSCGAIRLASAVCLSKHECVAHCLLARMCSMAILSLSLSSWSPSCDSAYSCDPGWAMFPCYRSI